MLVCPQCKSEYVDGVEFCSDCQVRLVSAALARALDPSDPDIQLVDVWDCQGETEAQLVRGILDSEGIDNLFKGEAVRTVHGFKITKLGTVTIQVREEDGERARRAILEARGLLPCPQCGELVERSAAECPECGFDLT